MSKKLELKNVSVAWARTDRTRKIAGLTALSVPFVLTALSAITHSRLPLPGELFFPTDLVDGWWQVAQWGSALLFLAAVTAWGLSRRAGGTPRREASVHIEGECIVVREHDRDTRTIELQQVEHAFAQKAHSGFSTVVVRLRGGETLSILVRPDEKWAALQALPPNMARRTARIPVGSLAARHWAAASVAWLSFTVAWLSLLIACNVGLEGSAVAWMWAGGFAGAMALMWPLMRRRHVEVGRDSVRIDGLFRRRYVPLDHIERVERLNQGGVALQLHGERSRVIIPAVSSGGDVADAIDAAIDARAAAKRDASEVDLTLLERGERSVEEWQRDLNKLSADANYRAQSLRIADLEDVVEDPTAAPTRRVAAAVALSGDEGAGRKIRIAADASADLDLRAALEAAREGEIAERQLSRAEKRHERD